MPGQILESFMQAAVRYLEWADRQSERNTNEARIALGLVSELYHRATCLANSGCGGETENMRINDEQWQAIHQRFSSLPFRYYSIVNNAMSVPPEAGEPVVGDIADDLADIYRDVAEGVALYKAGYLVEANWALHFSFQHHWGEHAAYAIYALHSYFMENPDRWDAAPKQADY